MTIIAASVLLVCYMMWGPNLIEYMLDDRAPAAAFIGLYLLGFACFIPLFMYGLGD